MSLPHLDHGDHRVAGIFSLEAEAGEGTVAGRAQASGPGGGPAKGKLSASQLVLAGGPHTQRASGDTVRFCCLPLKLPTQQPTGYYTWKSDHAVPYVNAFGGFPSHVASDQNYRPWPQVLAG